MLCGSLDGRGVWEGMDTCISMAEFLCCVPESIKTLLIGYTPIQNKKFNIKKVHQSYDSHCSCSVVSHSLWPRGLQHTRLSCPSVSPWACSNSFPLSWWCYLTISSSVALFSSCLYSFLSKGSFPMSQLFTSGGEVLDLQFQHQSFQWLFRVDFL